MWSFGSRQGRQFDNLPMRSSASRGLLSSVARQGLLSKPSARLSLPRRPLACWFSSEAAQDAVDDESRVLRRKYVRNCAIIAHVDHGRSQTLSLLVKTLACK